MKTQKTSGFYIRLRAEDKEAVENLYKSFGITFTDAVNMFIAKSLAENGLPFELKHKRYNAETENSITESREMLKLAKEGKIKSYDNTEDLFKALNI
ncbi:MAG: type II toxin-antitoxin system RelB/DinJ family antitoxin [Christensenellaceae bacterium]|jgi:DNA-damage-inducible protein J|nr:type II toxin-antitoxin system RelB/DinJ family antitoxin [Christensenellaceae bacterium]